MSTKSTRFTVGVDIEDIKLSITLDYVGSRGIIDETYVLHEHANNELFFMRRGGMLLECAWERISLREGEFYIISAGLPHRVVSCEQDVERFHFGFELITGENVECRFDKPHIVPDESERAGFVSLVDEIEGFSGVSIDLFGLYRLKASLGILMSRLLERQESIRAAYSGDRLGSMAQYRRITACRMIEQFFADNYQSGATICSLAESIGYSRSQTQRILRENYDMSFSEKMREMRMRTAARMLSQEDIGISDIAERCGYSSRQSFETAFSGYYGMTPAKFRERISSERS